MRNHGWLLESRPVKWFGLTVVVATGLAIAMFLALSFIVTILELFA